jgi:hypothetical protein
MQILLRLVLLSLCACTTGCLYLPVKEIKPPSDRSYEWKLTGAVRHVQFDIRDVGRADSPIRRGMSREGVHEILGPPDDPRDIDSQCAQGDSTEYFAFNGMEKYFYLLGESPVGTHEYITRYVLSVHYDHDNRIADLSVRRDSGVGILGL